MNLYPLQFIPVYHEKIWGGRSLSEVFGRELPAGKIGESWDIAAHAHGMSVVQNGPLAGKSLAEVAADYAEELYGQQAEYPDRFPLLVKIIDAREALSVQVHPNDAFAALHENGEMGKTEAWYVLAAAPDSTIVCGTKADVTLEQFKRLIEEGRIEEGLRTIPVQAGDIVEIPAGLVHALGEGIVVAEVQQNSDTVYRVYDWSRVDDQGQPRELHVDKAFSVMDFSYHPDPIRTDRNPVITNDYFCLEVLYQMPEVPIHDNPRFHILLCLEGQAQVRWQNHLIDLDPGDSCLIPAICRGYSLQVNGKLLRAYPPR